MLVGLISGGAVFFIEEHSMREEYKYTDGLKKEIEKKNGEKKVYKYKLQIIENQNKVLRDDVSRLNYQISGYIKDAKDAYVDKGEVVYDDGDGAKVILARLKHLNNYTEVKISPNKKYIAMLWLDKDDFGIEIYDIEEKTTLIVEKKDLDFYWTDDSRLIVVGSCDESSSCGLYESISSDEPWKLREIKKIF